MKKQFISVALLALLSTGAFAQAPQGIRYQGVARNNTGTPLNNQSLTVRLSVRDVNPTGTIVYQETHNVTTNQFGLYNLNIGQGSILQGSFAGINWGGANKYVEQEVDFGSGFVSMGTSQFMSVPYALYSGGSASGSWSLTAPSFNTAGQLVVNGTTGSGGPVNTASSAWLTNGNALTTTGMFGTTNNNHVDFITANVTRGRLTNSGQFVFGNSTVTNAGELATFRGTATNDVVVAAYVPAGSTGMGLAASVPTGNSGSIPAIYGEYNGSAIGNGVQGYYAGTSATLSRTSILGFCDGSATGGAGVYGYNGITTGNTHMGVLGAYDGSAAYGAGVIGIGAGGNLPAGNLDFGVVGWGANNSNYSGYFNGNHVVSNGTKSGSVPTSRGNQLLYVTESPEVWFEDIGGGTLSGGEATVELDPLFLETVVIDAEHKMRVFVQMEGESEEVFVTPGTTSFKVKERNNGSSNASFSYRVMAKRVHFQDHRFGNDPVWGPGDTRQYSEYSQPPLIDYEANKQLQEQKKRTPSTLPVPEGFTKGSQLKPGHAKMGK